MKKIILFMLPLLLGISCKVDDMQLKDAVEMGVVPEIVTVSAAGGNIDIPYYANLTGSIDFPAGASWAKPDKTTFSGDGKLSVNVSANDGIRRSARIIFVSDNDPRKDTVILRQEGVLDTLLLKSSSVVVYNKMGDTEIPASVTVAPASVKATVRYLDTDAEPWVKACSVKEDKLVIRTEDNPSADAVRSAVLTLSWTNGWSQKIRRDINLTQATSAASGNLIGVPATFESVRAMATEDPMVISEDLFLEGYIVSDNASRNVTENTQRTSTSIDYTVTDRSAVFESEDGTLGFLLEALSVEDNVFEPWSKVSLLLRGTQIRKYTNPDRYVISNIRSSCVASSKVVGKHSVPAREMHISQLTDSDIYTRITLTDCEFPIRKGGLTPLNEGYTRLYGADWITKFASLIRDIDGASVYVYTNTTCPYRRDGRRIGNGSGSISGTVVSEPYESFQDVGRYQLRHQEWEDLDFADSFEHSFSGLICEWRYLRQGNADHSWSATQGAGTMSHTYTATSAMNSKYSTWCHPVYDQSYLGPVFSGCTNQNGFGIILEDGSDYAASYTGSVDKGQLLASAGWPMAWMKETWVSSSGNYYAWTLNFSTTGISTDHLSLQISTLNASQEGMSPVHWKVEWAESADGPWTTVTTYNVPDIVLWTITQPWQSGGFKPIDIPLPLEMLGKASVYVRLIPADRAGNSTHGYCDSNFKNGSVGSSSKANNSINYVAVRYNK